MRKLGCGRALDLLCMFSGAAYTTSNNVSHHHHHHHHHEEDEDEEEDNKPLILPTSHKPLKLKDVLDPPPTLAFQLKPKMVVLRVSMHCNGCARRVEKHISKLEGVTSYEVDLETKMVVVRGDIVPFEILESVSKVKYAQLWE